jgi:hypothetical protein
MKQFLIIFNFLFLTNLALASNNLNYSDVISLQDYQGQTFFSLMTEVIKPALDEKATQGFKVASGRTVVKALELVDEKVSKKAIRAAGSVEELKKIADTLNRKNKMYTFYELPEVLAELGVGAGRFDLTTYLALVSGGGVAVQIDELNIGYNVNYGTGENENDERTGRSFAEAPDRLALDASDKHYLQILEAYIRKNKSNTKYFYQSILEILVNNDVSNFQNITPEGQAVAADFVAVYTAEQNRHLMSDLKRHPWDEALLEVTLLSALHAGQKQIQLMYNGEFTSVTHKQTTGCDASEKVEKKASLVDYWQFSSSEDPAHCKRSGLNVNRKDFRSLGKMITAFQKEQNPELVARLQKHFKTSRNKDNVFAQLSDYLINYNTARSLGRQGEDLVADFTEFLMQVQKDANLNSEFINSNWSGETE